MSGNSSTNRTLAGHQIPWIFGAGTTHTLVTARIICDNRVLIPTYHKNFRVSDDHKQISAILLFGHLKV